MAKPQRPMRTGTPAVVTAGVVAVLLSLLIVLAGPLGTRWGWWAYPTGFTMLRYGIYALVATSVLTLLAALAIPSPTRQRSVMLAILLVILAAGVAAVPWSMRRVARTVPPIHDITTDMQDPPAFEAVLSLRGDARNPPEYPGEETARQQRAAYPDIGPLVLEAPPGVALDRAARAAHAMGWQVVNVDSARHRLEAVARTRWFGFRDDVVVRITPEGDRSRVDVRSKSRVGRSDLGANARRIRAFMAVLADTA